MSSPFAVIDIHDDVLELLRAEPDLTVYDGEVETSPPTNADGTVSAYAVFYLSPGERFASGLDGAQDALTGGFQITCAGGDPTTAAWAVGAVRRALLGSTVTVDGRAHRIWAEPGDPGPMRRDDAVKPPRHYVPLRFTVPIP